MKTSNLIRSFGLSIIVAGLSACNSNDVVQEVPKTVAPPVISKISFSGKIRTNDASSASVSIKVGGTTYSSGTPTDATGAFRVEIDAADANDMVVVEAYIPAQGVRLVSVPGSYGELMARAQSGVVGELDLNALTTAGFAITTSRASDRRVDSASEYVRLMEDVTTSELVNVASAVEIVANSLHDTVLPGGYGDTLELALDVAGGDVSFTSDMEILHPGITATAIDSLHSRNTSGSGFSKQGGSGVYFSYDTYTLYSLFDNGSGIASFFDDDVAKPVPQWTIDDSGDLVLNYATDQSRQDRVRLLHNSAITKHTFHERVQLPNSTGQISPATFSYYPFADAYTAAEIAGSYSLSGSDASALVLNTDGTGSRLDGEGEFIRNVNWVLAGDGRLILDEGLRYITIVTRLQGAEGMYPALMSVVGAGGVVQNMHVANFHPE